MRMRDHWKGKEEAVEMMTMVMEMMMILEKSDGEETIRLLTWTAIAKDAWRNCKQSRPEVWALKVGWIIRDYQGSYLEAGWATLPQVRSPLQAEATGFWYKECGLWDGDKFDLKEAASKLVGSCQ
ncbi:unnamed protein product [Microthlaspi erraticum]|uniref:Uncharacterized protein n=1 Tax=Microthlaspi erraticum TaxID=1685480 RepID=A0A6D2I0I6_9BRAS|nr:unnamed protein product [Microthlaspi erraticum]